MLRGSLDRTPGAATHETVTFVDFEYAGYNPRGFDLGNYFCEMAVDNGCDGLPWPGFCMARKAPNFHSI